MSKRNDVRYHNHKVVSVEFDGCEDVFNITVDRLHNYALSSGVVVSNCALEFRIAACVWKDDSMIAYASDPKLDIHRDMAAACYLLDEVPKTARFYAKNQFVFPTLYGSYYINCAKNLWNAIDANDLCTADGDPLKQHLDREGIYELGLCDSRETAEEGTFERLIQGVEKDFNDRFPQWSERKEKAWENYQKRGQFKMVTGFVCEGAFGRNDIYNWRVQGPAFHILLWSLIQMVKWLKKNNMKTRIVGQIHDSLMLDIHRDEFDLVIEKVKQVMTQDVRDHWSWIVTPMEVGIEVSETNWFEKKELVL